MKYVTRSFGLPIKLRLIRGIHWTSACNAGHSKWANIRHIKALKDGQKSLQFIKLSRQIRLAVQGTHTYTHMKRHPIEDTLANANNFYSHFLLLVHGNMAAGGSVNPSLNTELRSAIDAAQKRNMPNATIQNILQKCAATPVADNKQLKKMLIQLRIQAKIFAIVVVYSDNLALARIQLATILRRYNVIAQDIRHLFSEKGFIEAYATDMDCSSNSPANATVSQLEETATNDAIEAGIEELEIIDAPTKHIMVHIQSGGGGGQVRSETIIYVYVYGSFFVFR